MEIKLDGGKYVWLFNEQSGRQEALHHGEPWRDLTGDNLTLAMGQRIATLEAALTEAHRVILHELDNGRTPYLLKAENGGKGFGYLEDTLSGGEAMNYIIASGDKNCLNASASARRFYVAKPSDVNLIQHNEQLKKALNLALDVLKSENNIGDFDDEIKTIEDTANGVIPCQN